MVKIKKRAKFSIKKTHKMAINQKISYPFSDYQDITQIFSLVIWAIFGIKNFPKGHFETYRKSHTYKWPKRGAYVLFSRSHTKSFREVVFAKKPFEIFQFRKKIFVALFKFSGVLKQRKFQNLALES